jgi:HEAT repeat protein
MAPGIHLRRYIALLLAPILLLLFVPLAAAVSEGEVEQIIAAERIDLARLKSYGPAVMPPLVELYRRADEATRTKIAWVFYELSFKSEEARQALMQDVHTKRAGLRLQVQWALGRVSDNPDVVRTLLANMQHDPNPLFRDKAACALASDQVHLAEPQKVELFEGLIVSLESRDPQVRSIAIKALKIQTGQTKNYRPNAPADERAAAIGEWRRWLAEYKSNL